MAKRWRILVWLGIGVGAMLLIARGQDAPTPASPATTSTTTTTTTTTTPAAVPATGERPTEALADGAEELVREIPAFDNIELDIVDVVVIAAIVVAALWLLWPRRFNERPVSIAVVDGSGDGTDVGRSPKSPQPHVDAIAALVRDRLNRVDLRPPSSVPSAEEAVGSVIDVVESVEPGKPVASVARALTRLNPGHSLGFQARLTLRRSDTTTKAGITVELDDLDARTNISVKTVWGETFEDAARQAAFQLAATLLRRLPRRARRGIWWRWDESGLSLKKFEDAKWAIRGRRYDAAVRHLDEALKSDPSNLAIRLQLGQTYERLHMYQDALWTYQRVLDWRSPLARTDRRTREAGLIRWRAAVVLANAPSWVDEWVGAVVPPESNRDKMVEPRHETSRRLRAFFDERYMKALDQEFATVRKTFLCNEEDRRQTLVEISKPTSPALFLARYDRIARLFGDEGPESTLGTLWQKVGGGTVVAKPRDRRFLDVHERVESKLRTADDQNVRRAAPAVSLVHYAWRAAEVEVAEMSGFRRRRRRAGLSRADVAAFHLGMNHRRLAGLALTKEERWELSRIALWLRVLILANRVLARLGYERAKEARPQAEYNAACALVLNIPPPPDDDSGWKAWRSKHDRAVDRVVELLARSCQGEHNLVERAAADWIVFDDPDIERIRRHPKFCRFAKAVLHREIPSRVTSPDVFDQYLHVIERRSIDVGLAVWRAAIETTPTASAVATLAKHDAALHQRLTALLAEPSSKPLRDAVDEAMTSLDTVQGGLPEWPQRAKEGSALPAADPRVVTLKGLHERFSSESTEAARRLLDEIDRRGLAIAIGPLVRRRRVQALCRARLAAWLVLDEAIHAAR